LPIASRHEQPPEPVCPTPEHRPASVCAGGTGTHDAERNWPATLSVGEQQLLACARLLLANPRFAFLDQAVSSLGPLRGEQLYRVLAATSITYLSVGNHSHIQEYHDLVLELFEDGTWQTRAARSARRA
jgi:putative ATP-binding cassette transporter